MFYKRNKRKQQEKPLGGMTVTVRQIRDKDGNVTSDVNGALRVLKKKLLKEGVFQELRERSFYESRGTKKRKAKAAATRRYKRKMQKRMEELGY